MITKWKILDPLHDNTTTFRFWCDDENRDLDLADLLVNKYVNEFGYKSNGLIKIKYNFQEIFFEIITNLPYKIYRKNNNFFEFVPVNDSEFIGVKNN
jgi:hypothetical protein